MMKMIFGILKVLDKIDVLIFGIRKMLDKVDVMDTLKVSDKLDTVKVLCNMDTLKVSNVMDTVKVSNRLDTIEESALETDPQGLMLVCKGPDAIKESVRLDTVEESVEDMDLSDVKCKLIEQYQVVYEINLEDEIILQMKMMDIPWKEFQWECSSMR